jgi:hypothetical protein
VSALAWYLEDEGVPTVAISLVRLHSEKVGNPRSLWVPFELGRPLGAPADAAFQRRVLLTALCLLEAQPGPVVLEDFNEDAPGSADDPGWTPAFDLVRNHVDLSDAAALRRALAGEWSIVEPWYRRFVSTTGRTTVGVSGMSIEVALDFMTAWLGATPPASPDVRLPAAQILRFAIDDVKACYLEALSAGPGLPSSRQAADWFWDGSVAARMIVAIREGLIGSDDRRSVAIGRGSLIPRAQLQRLGLP